LARFQGQSEAVPKKDGLAPPPERTWTQIDDYLGALARRRTARRSREGGRRTQSDEPRFSLSTLPFMLLIGALLVITVGIAVIAWPGSQPAPVNRIEPREIGKAPKGWFQEAQREFHKQR
jgi:hypothetical protein